MSPSTKLRLSLLALMFISVCFSTDLFSQVVGNGATNANFSVDADLESDTARFGSVSTTSSKGAGTDDWFKYKSGSGMAVIDTTGAYIFKASYKSNISNYQKGAFTRGLSHPKLTLSNGYVLLDALYGKDFAQNDTTAFVGSTAGGSAKTLEAPANWQIGIGNVNNKGDILDFMSHVRRKGTTVNDSLFMFVAMAIKSTSGAKNAAIELFVNDLQWQTVPGQTYRTLSSAGNSEGRTAWRFDQNGNIIQIGDFVLSFDYKSSSGFDIEPRIWVADSFRNSASPNYVTPANFDWASGWDKLGSSSKYGYQAIAPKGALNFAWGVANSSSETRTPPWGSMNISGAWDSMYDAEQFIEISVNFTTLGVDPASIDGINPCSVPYRTITYRTRQASSFTSSIEDFAGPFPFWRYPVIGDQGITDTLSCRQPTADLSIDGEYALAYYDWSTVPGSGGNIVSYNSDSTVITVNEAGRYVLASAPLEGCYLTTDTLSVLKDTAHPVARIYLWDTLVSGSVNSVILYGGDTVATNARMNLDSAIFGPSQGLVWNWTGMYNGFVSNEEFPATMDSGSYVLKVTEQRNGCFSLDTATLVLLPVNFTKFNCAKNLDGVLLNWEIQSENPLSHFIVQKWDGEYYKEIGRVEAYTDNNGSRNYLFLDNKPLPGPNVYRIAVSTMNGDLKYSEPCATTISSAITSLPAVLSVYPNPGSGEFTVVSAVHASDNAVVFLFDVSGRVMLQRNLRFNERGESHIDLSGYSPGFYYLGIQDGLIPQTTKLSIK